jgi:topoisomerase-4 subunit A
MHYFAGAPSAWLLLSNTGGYGFLATVENMMSRLKAGKAFLSVGEGESVCRPSPANVAPQPPATQVCCISAMKRILTFDITELKAMPNGGRGLMLIDLEKKDELVGAAAYIRSVKITGISREKEREEVLEIRSLNNAKAGRGRKGKTTELGFKPSAIERVE